MFFIYKDEQPYSVVEDEGFTYLMKVAVPLYHVPGRKTIPALIDKRYLIAKEAYISILQKGLSYTLTCDCWTDRTFQCYLGVTIHYLSEELEMKSGYLGVFPLDKNHTANYLLECLQFVVDDFKLDKSKIMAVTTDGTANIKKAARDLVGAEWQIWCFAHFISHLVPSVLTDFSELTKLIEKVRRIITIIRRSTVASEELKRQQMSDGETEGTCLKFILDATTRWNSTLYMLERFLMLEKYAYAAMKKCTRKEPPDMLSNREISVLAEIVAVMKPIELVIKEISGSSYATCSVIIPIVSCMRSSVERLSLTYEIAIDFQKQLLKKIDDKFADVETKNILEISTILDPRFKELYCVNSRALGDAKDYIKSQLESAETSSIEVIKESSPIPQKKEQISLWETRDKLVTASTARHKNETKKTDEVNRYLAEALIPRFCDPLNYWMSHHSSFPTLHKLALRYVSIIGTSVPSERLFSDAGSIKSTKRSRLSGEHLKHLLFLGSLSKEDWKLD